MGILLFIALLAGLVALLVRYGRKGESRVDAAWARAAGALGGTFARAADGEGRKIEATVEGCSVEVVEASAGNGRGVRFTVGCRGIPLDLALEAEGGVAGLKRVLRGEDIRIRGGFFESKELEFFDGPFDELVKVRGPEDTARAALGPTARKAVFELMSKEPTVQLSQGSLVLERPGPFERFADLESRVRAMVRAAAQLRVADACESLARNVREEPVRGARLLGLKVLGRQYAGQAAAREAAMAALADPEPRIQLAAAAIVGGEEERAALEGLLAGPKKVPGGIRVEALRRLVEVGEPERVRPRVAQMLGSEVPAELCAAMKAAADLRDEAALPRICELSESADAGVASAAASALGDLGDVRGQPALLRLLPRENADLRQAVVVALGKVGDVGAVESLLPLAEAVFPGALRDAAREAIRRIQDRLGEVGAGRLSVVEGQDGAAGLSVVGPAASAEPEPGGEQERRQRSR